MREGNCSDVSVLLSTGMDLGYGHSDQVLSGGEGGGWCSDNEPPDPNHTPPSPSDHEPPGQGEGSDDHTPVHVSCNMPHS